MSTTTTHTLAQATDAARTAMAAYWLDQRTSMVTAVRVACISPSGGRTIVKMQKDGWQVQGDAWQTISDADSAKYRTILVESQTTGMPIVLGASGDAWMSRGI